MIGSLALLMCRSGWGMQGHVQGLGFNSQHKYISTSGCIFVPLWLEGADFSGGRWTLLSLFAILISNFQSLSLRCIWTLMLLQDSIAQEYKETSSAVGVPSCAGR